MSSRDLLISIVRYIQSRYDLDVDESNVGHVIKAAAYLAKCKQDQRLCDYIISYQSMNVGKGVVPVLDRPVYRDKLQVLTKVVAVD